VTEAPKIVFRRKGVSAPAAVVPSIAPVDFDALFNGYMESNQKTWGHDRTKTLGGSEVFGCIRKAWYSRHATAKDASYKDSWGATERGNLIENHHVVPAMQWGSKNLGFKIDYIGADQQTLFCDGVPMSVTPDGLIHGVPRNWLSKYGIPDIKSDCVMFEIKSIDPRVDLSEEKAIHHGQTQIQMGLVRENTSFKPHFAVLLYVNASFFDDMSVFIVEWDPKKYEVAKQRAHHVYDTASPDLLIREGRIDGSCTYCPFTEACQATMVKAFPKAKDEDETPKGKKKKATDSAPEVVARLDGLMERAHAARAKLKKVTKEDALIKEELKGALREVNERRAKSGNWSLSYGMQSGRSTLDKDKIELTFNEIQGFVKEAGLETQFDELLKKLGFGDAEQNTLRRVDDMEAFMKIGDSFETLRMTFTEPDAEEL
jgi:hypothetical protein